MRLKALCVLTTVLFCVVTAIPAGASSTLRFDGDIIEHTCEIPGTEISQPADIGVYTVGELMWMHPGAVVKTVPLTYHITGCPDGVTSAGLRVDYSEEGYRNLLTEGGGDGLVYSIHDGNDAGFLSGIAPGATVLAHSFSPATGSGQVALQVVARRGGTQTPGDVNATATLTLVYQ